MSFVGDITVALEALVRGAVPTIPAGADGVSYANRLPQRFDASPRRVEKLVLGLASPT